MWLWPSQYLGAKVGISKLMQNCFLAWRRLQVVTDDLSNSELRWLGFSLHFLQMISYSLEQLTEGQQWGYCWSEPDKCCFHDRRLLIHNPWNCSHCSIVGPQQSETESQSSHWCIQTLASEYAACLCQDFIHQCSIMSQSTCVGMDELLFPSRKTLVRSRKIPRMLGAGAALTTSPSKRLSCKLSFLSPLHRPTVSNH